MKHIMRIQARLIEAGSRVANGILICQTWSATGYTNMVFSSFMAYHFSTSGVAFALTLS